MRKLKRINANSCGLFLLKVLNGQAHRDEEKNNKEKKKLVIFSSTQAIQTPTESEFENCLHVQKYVISCFATVMLLMYSIVL